MPPWDYLRPTPLRWAQAPASSADSPASQSATTRPSAMLLSAVIIWSQSAQAPRRELEALRPTPPPSVATLKQTPSKQRQSAPTPLPRSMAQPHLARVRKPVRRARPRSASTAMPAQRFRWRSAQTRSPTSPTPYRWARSAASARSSTSPPARSRRQHRRDQRRPAAHRQPARGTGVRRRRRPRRQRPAHDADLHHPGHELQRRRQRLRCGERAARRERRQPLFQGQQQRAGGAGDRHRRAGDGLERAERRHQLGRHRHQLAGDASPAPSPWASARQRPA